MARITAPDQVKQVAPVSFLKKQPFRVSLLTVGPSTISGPAIQAISLIIHSNIEQNFNNRVYFDKVYLIS
jgi:hypothetical protein